MLDAGAVETEIGVDKSSAWSALRVATESIESKLGLQCSLDWGCTFSSEDFTQMLGDFEACTDKVDWNFYLTRGITLGIAHQLELYIQPAGCIKYFHFMLQAFYSKFHIEPGEFDFVFEIEFQNIFSGSVLRAGPESEDKRLVRAFCGVIRTLADSPGVAKNIFQLLWRSSITTLVVVVKNIKLSGRGWGPLDEWKLNFCTVFLIPSIHTTFQLILA